MNDRVAKTATIETAWELMDLLDAACPANIFVAVSYGEFSGFEVVPMLAFHPDDRKLAGEIVADFVKRKQREANR